MSKIRIYELAKQLNVANKDLMEKIHSVGIEAKSHMGMLTEEEAAKVTAL
ncbi:MAG: translation initiation factor IF-2 N-terminal domain-containing protein, partial [Anaerotignum sp.]|nr:translation initiation factor IF-2 N-terminal domain-containing protein [Anaerotignum sp.]